MNELIRINKSAMEGQQVNTVNARDLHEFLEIGKVFGAWITERIDQFEFVENQDFVVVSENGKNPKGGRPAKEYHLTLDMAKELSMVERNEKGKQARRYFIECEQRLHSNQTVASKLTKTIESIYPKASKYIEVMNLSSELDIQLCQSISDKFADYLKEINANVKSSKHTNATKRTNILSESQVIDGIQNLNTAQKERLFFILNLLKQKNQFNKLSQSELAEHLGMDRKTIYNDMALLIAGGLVKAKRGYCPTDAFPLFFKKLMGQIQDNK